MPGSGSLRAENDLMNVEQAAQYLGLAVATLYTWRTRRVGPPAARIGNRLKYSRALLDQWIDGRMGHAGQRSRAAS
jgi:predicted DNA-binding transcriptional regulator AlpA